MKESRDGEQNPTEALKSLGLTKYEALVYIGLLRVHDATATEVHEISGVPRASVYPVLDRLVQRDLVSISHTSPRRFRAFPPEDGVKRLMHRIEEQAEYATETLQEIYTERGDIERGDQDLIWTIYGLDNIMSRLAEALTHAEEEVRILSCWKLINRSVLPLILELSERNVKVEIATDHWEGPIPHGLMVRIKKPPMGHDRFGRDAGGGLFLIDQQKVLAIVNALEENPTALYSESDGFLKLFMQFWNNIIALRNERDQ